MQRLVGALAIGLVGLALPACQRDQRRTETKMTQATEITDASQLDAHVGQVVTLRGVVTNTRMPTLLGCDVESDEPDLRGEPAIATGRLERDVVTQEQLDKITLEQGQSTHRGPGKYYALVDAKTGRLAQVQKR